MMHPVKKAVSYPPRVMESQELASKRAPCAVWMDVLCSGCAMISVPAWCGASVVCIAVVVHLLEAGARAVIV